MRLGSQRNVLAGIEDKMLDCRGWGDQGCRVYMVIQPHFLSPSLTTLQGAHFPDRELRPKDISHAPWLQWETVGA